MIQLSIGSALCVRHQGEASETVHRIADALSYLVCSCVHVCACVCMCVHVCFCAACVGPQVICTYVCACDACCVCVW